MRVHFECITIYSEINKFVWPASLGCTVLIMFWLVGSLKASTDTYVWVPYFSGASFLLCAIVVQIGQIPKLWKWLACNRKSVSITKTE